MQCSVYYSPNLTEILGSITCARLSCMQPGFQLYLKISQSRSEQSAVCCLLCPQTVCRDLSCRMKVLQNVDIVPEHTDVQKLIRDHISKQGTEVISRRSGRLSYNNLPVPRMPSSSASWARWCGSMSSGPASAPRSRPSTQSSATTTPCCCALSAASAPASTVPAAPR